jgi:hypothetical protein
LRRDDRTVLARRRNFDEAVAAGMRELALETIDEPPFACASEGAASRSVDLDGGATKDRKASRLGLGVSACGCGYRAVNERNDGAAARSERARR